MTFDPVAMCRILNEEHVDYVVVGEFASVILGSPLPTEDIDVIPDMDTRSLILNLVTDHGILDLTFQPSGPLTDYEAWNAAASSEQIADHLTVRVASIDDIIASKQAADRAKDRRVLPYLESLRDVMRSDS